MSNRKLEQSERNYNKKLAKLENLLQTAESDLDTDRQSNQAQYLYPLSKAVKIIASDITDLDKAYNGYINTCERKQVNNDPINVFYPHKTHLPVEQSMIITGETDSVYIVSVTVNAKSVTTAKLYMAKTLHPEIEPVAKPHPDSTDEEPLPLITMRHIITAHRKWLQDNNLL